MSLYPTQVLYKCLLLIEVPNWGELEPPIFNKLMNAQTLTVPVSIFCFLSICHSPKQVYVDTLTFNYGCPFST